MKRTLICCLIGLLVCMGGCSKKPKGFPKVYPTKITVAAGNEPVVGAKLYLLHKTAQPACVTVGTTDSSGKAVMYTQQNDYSVPGAPEGSYTVVVEEVFKIEQTKTPEEQVKMSPAEMVAYDKEYKKKLDAIERKVPDQFTKKNTSPLSFEVKSGKNEGTFNVLKNQ